MIARDGLICGVFFVQGVVGFDNADEGAVGSTRCRAEHSADVAVVEAHNAYFHGVPFSGGLVVRLYVLLV